ncbi:Uncharacterised protein [Raoultella terrigena]|uniref:YycE-like N-terminal domain-containing protein n=1 Tax=Raoultella terrigena TaxID=577 RepID=A0A4U9D3C5_RAOTE|nr:Uncharacterised protein [Raoultella terrigena]
MSFTHLRIARPVTRLAHAFRMYAEGLGLQKLPISRITMVLAESCWAVKIYPGISN